MLLPDLKLRPGNSWESPVIANTRRAEGSPTRRTNRSLAVRLLDEVVHQLRRAVVHLHVERLNLVSEVVEEHHGGDGDEKAEGRRNEGFRDTAGHRADTGRLGAGDRLEGVQNADHRTEQADKGGGGTDGGQTAETLLQLGMNDRLRPLERALGALNLLFRDRAARTERAELGETRGDDFGKVRLLGLVGDLDGLIQAAFLQSVRHARSEFAGLLASRREVDRPIDNDGQRPDRHDEEDDDHGAGQIAHVAPELHGAEANLTAGSLVLKEHGERSGGNVSGLCEMSENHGLLLLISGCERLLCGTGRTV